MKSAYEIAMEKLQKESPDPKLTDAQRAGLAELDNRYQAKIAEREVFLEGKIAEAAAAGEFEAVEQIKRELTGERKMLLEELEEKKEAVRQQG
ncbi:MAG: hypothetical protein CMO74_09960 [Verrucomicrobiales bacterium]|nr:hypothetical protein [Verrucomicrobiales bacterium]|tara:strand:+ start:121 stop:399 length:279 start_codon:yes stop_codon:yes gene_type:complete